MNTFLIVAIALIILLVMIYTYFGGFHKIQINKTFTGGESVFCKEIVGDYRQSGKVMDEIYHKLNKSGITTYKGFGKYYDNPKKVAKDQLRSEAGCVLETGDSDKITGTFDGYKLKKLDQKEFVTASFPYKGKMSVLFSIMRVYPALNAYMAKNGMEPDSPVIEIYDIPNKMVLYRKEILNKV